MIVMQWASDGKHFAPETYQQDILIADMPEQGFAGKVAQWNALCEIRPGRWGWPLSSSLPPLLRRN